MEQQSDGDKAETLSTEILLIMSTLQTNGLRQLLPDTRGDDCSDIDQDAN